MKISWAGIRERKLVQWGIAYLAGAWLALQILAILASSYQWPATVMRLAPLVLAVGFLAVLVLAWYHGERGLQRATGIELLILSALLVLGGAVIAFLGPEETAPTETNASGAAMAGPPVEDRSIAVLPFDNLSVDTENAYFADGITEEITLALTKVPELRVVSRTSASQYAGSQKSIRDIAGELGVATVLEGSVRRAGDRVRITAQLIDARTDEHLWAETYDRELADVFQIQSEIAQQIAEELQASFTHAERERILAGSTRDPVAHDLYLRAVALVDPVDAGMNEVEPAIEFLRQAVRRDPSFARAWDQLFVLHIWSISWNGPASSDSAQAALDRALALDPDSPRARFVEARRAWFVDRQRDRAIELARQATELAPSDPQAVQSLAEYHLWNGDLSEAVRWGERLVALDPRTPPAHQTLIRSYIQLELDDRAEHAIRRLIRIAPSTADGWIELSALRLRQGRYDDALAAADSALLRSAGDPRFAKGLALLWRGDARAAIPELEALLRSTTPERTALVKPSLAHAYRVTGEPDRAEDVLAGVAEGLEFGLREVGWNPPVLQYALAETVAAAGDTTRALDELEQYVRTGGRDARLVAADPALGTIRGTPRYEAVLNDLRERNARMRAAVQER